MSQSLKEFFFLIYFNKKTKPKDEVNFKSNENSPICIFTKTFESNENVELIKIFKFSGEPKKEEIFEFSFDNEDFKLTLENLKEQTFIFDIILNQRKKNFISILMMRNLNKIR